MISLILLLSAAALAEETIPSAESQMQYDVNQMFKNIPDQSYNPAQYVYAAQPRHDHHTGAPQPGGDAYGPGVPVANGPWVTVPQAPYQPHGRDPYGIGVSAGLGFDTQSLVTWGLGAVILLLIISTAIQLVGRLLPSFKSLVEEAGSGRSMETVSSLAQFALEAMQKYEEMNEDDDQ